MYWLFACFMFHFSFICLKVNESQDQCIIFRLQLTFENSVIHLESGNDVQFPRGQHQQSVLCCEAFYVNYLISCACFGIITPSQVPPL